MVGGVEWCWMVLDGSFGWCNVVLLSVFWSWVVACCVLAGCGWGGCY